MKIAMLFIALLLVSFAQGQQAVFSSHTTFVGPEGRNIVSEFKEGVALIKQEGKFGMVNKQGQEVCPPKFEQARLFHEGYAAVQLHGKWSFVNKQGKRLTAFDYDWVSNFEKGFARVRIGKEWTLLNELGHELTEQRFDAIGAFQEGRVEALRDGTYYWIYEDGTVVEREEGLQAKQSEISPIQL